MAVGDFIKIDRTVNTATKAPDLSQVVTSLQRVIEQIEHVKGMMDHMTTAQIETEFGLAAGNGTIVQALITSCRGAVRSSSTLEIIDRVG